MEPDPFRSMNDNMAAFKISMRALHQHMETYLPPRPTHRVAFAREPDGVRASCTDCLGHGWGLTVEAARAAILADLRRLHAERQAAERQEAARQAAGAPPDFWEETLTLDEEPPPC